MTNHFKRSIIEHVKIGTGIIYSFVKNEFNAQYNPINSDYYDTLGMSSLIAKREIPASHKRLANNYMIIKKVFGFSAVPVKPTNTEFSLLKHYNFSTLEQTSIRHINQELESIKKWMNSNDEFLKKHAEQLFEIRVKELKYLQTTKYFPTGEFCDGYKALEKYLEFIAS